MHEKPQPSHVQQTGMHAVPMELTKQFYFKHKSSMDGKVYEGQFTTKKLSVKDLALIGVKKTQLNGGYHFDESNPGAGVNAETDWINTMLAHLEISVIQAPMWFNFETIYDAELLGEVFKRVSEFENSFFRPKRDRNVDPGSSQNDSSRESEESGTAGHVAPVGGGEVSPSLDP
jgi:hypothetical protein